MKKLLLSSILLSSLFAYTAFAQNRQGTENELIQSYQRAQQNIPNFLNEFNFEGYYQKYASELEKYARQNYSDDEAKRIKELMSQEKTKRDILILMSNCFALFKQENERANCVGRSTSGYLNSR